MKLKNAGMSYAFLMALSNVSGTLGSLAGAALYGLFSQPWMLWFLNMFRGSFLDVAGSADTRTIILQIFVYISLTFTLFAALFVFMLSRQLMRAQIQIRLGAHV